MITDPIKRFDTSLTVPQAVDALEVEMLKGEQVECPVYHHFSPGLYVREVNLPAGCVAIGHRQKTEHLNIFLKGKVSIVNDDGTTSLLEAPLLFTGQPGRKCGYVHEDVVWLNVYPTTETDIEALESMFLDKSANWKDSQIKAAERISDREDFKRIIKELGFTEETVRAQSEDETDQIPFPSGSYRVAVCASQIEGRGLFATANIKAGEYIAPARIAGKRTPAGRYTNHAKTPNAKMEREGGGMCLVAIHDIQGMRGGLIGDEITVHYGDVYKLHEVKR